jgi:hypothetical protein
LTRKNVKVDPVLCDQEAYDAMLAGDMETHDRIVRDTLKELLYRNDVLLLAQGSMARVTDTRPPAEKVAPILSSPRLAMERVLELLNETVG